MARSKVCFKCGTDKPVSDFYAHKGMADGLLGKCKSCTKLDASTHRTQNIDKIREYDRARGKITERAKKAAAISQAWRAEDNRRARGHSAVARALKKGTIIPKNCAWPGCDSSNTVAHHESYDRPLDVVWYCQPHHNKRHKEMKAEGINP